MVFLGFIFCIDKFFIALFLLLVLIGLFEEVVLVVNKFESVKTDISLLLIFLIGNI